MQVGGVGLTWDSVERTRVREFSAPSKASLQAPTSVPASDSERSAAVTAGVVDEAREPATADAAPQNDREDDRAKAAGAPAEAVETGEGEPSAAMPKPAATSLSTSADDSMAAPPTTGAKTPEEQRQLQELKDTDRHVRSHEQAHLAAAGGLASGGATFEYERGPDNQLYAVGGEVSIDVSPGRTPQETITKAARIRAAALAPADPSGQDRAVAAAATAMAAQASAELAKQAQAARLDGAGATDVAAMTASDGPRAETSVPSPSVTGPAVATPGVQASTRIASLAAMEKATRAYAPLEIAMPTMGRYA